MVAALVDAFEGIVDDTTARHYSYQDRKKIALGMVAIMVGRGISLEKITYDPTLFALVMAESVGTLTRAGEISER